MRSVIDIDLDYNRVSIWFMEDKIATALNVSPETELIFCRPEPEGEESLDDK